MQVIRLIRFEGRYTMVRKSEWQEMKRHAFEAFKSAGRMDADKFQQIVEIGGEEGEFDEDEKIVLINIISNLTRADMDDALWTKVHELIHKLELHDDGDATIEALHDEEHEL